MKPWLRLESRRLTVGPLQLEEDRVQRPDGHEAVYVVLRARGFACVCPVLPDGRVGLVRQYRYPLAATTLELPSGAIENGETALDAATRETVEEAGLAGGTWEPLGSFSTMPGRSDESAHLFLARNVEIVGPPRRDELTERVLCSFDEALSLVTSVRDALCLRLARERLDGPG